MFFGYVCSDVFVWLVVVVIFEWFMFMCYFFKVMLLCWVCKVVFVIFFVLVFLIFVNFYIFWIIGLILDLNNVIVCGLYEFIILIWFCIDLVVYFVLFFLSIGIFNVKIIGKICKMKWNLMYWWVFLMIMNMCVFLDINIKKKLIWMMVVLLLIFVVMIFFMVVMFCVMVVFNLLKNVFKINC